MREPAPRSNWASALLAAQYAFVPSEGGTRESVTSALSFSGRRNPRLALERPAILALPDGAAPARPAG